MPVEEDERTSSSGSHAIKVSTDLRDEMRCFKRDIFLSSLAQVQPSIWPTSASYV